MSHSYRHTPKGWPHCSEQKEKRLANRKMRRLVSVALVFEVEEETVFPIMDEIANKWGWSKDGSRGWHGHMKNDPDPWRRNLYLKGMRK